MSGVTEFCFLASYLVAFLLEIVRVIRPYKWLHLGSFVMTISGLVAQTFYLISRSQQVDRPPLVGSSHDWILVLAWLVIVATVATSGVFLIRNRSQSFNLFALPMALLLVIAARFSNHDAHTILDQLSTLKMVHSATLVLGVAGVSIGFLLSLMYLWQHRRLKAKQFGLSRISLPSLETLVTMNRWSIFTSIPMLSIGMGTGVVLALAKKETPQSVSILDPYILCYVFVWALMFALFAWVVISRNRQGRQVALMTAWAFGFLLITMLGLQMMSGLAGGTDGWHG